jgi:YegS/Rv2252/BmrU family lipid kinase
MHKNIKYLFIINPIAGVKKQERIVSAIEKHFQNSNCYAIYFAKDKTAAEEEIKTAVSKNIPYIIAVGGDGTVNIVSKYLANSDSILGIIPTGSGNGLAHFLKIPFKLNKNLKALEKGTYHYIDSATINNQAFISIAGIGFDAYIAALFNQSKRRGFFTYLKLVIRAYFRYKEQEYSFIADGKSYKRKAFLISFANSNQFGYKTIISPIAKIDDGLLDICIVKRPSPLIALFIWPMIFLKKFHKTKYLEIIQAKEIQLKNRRNTPINIDGDSIMNKNDDILLQVKPKSIKIIDYVLHF